MINSVIVESGGKWIEEVQETDQLQHLHHWLLFVDGHSHYQHDESQKHLRVNFPGLRDLPTLRVGNSHLVYELALTCDLVTCSSILLHIW